MKRKYKKYTKERVKKYLNCLTDEALIKLLDVDKKLITKWKDGIEVPDLKYLMRIGSHFGTSAEDILGINIFCSDQVLVSFYDEFGKIRAHDIIGHSNKFVGIFFNNSIEELTNLDVLPYRSDAQTGRDDIKIKYGEKLMDTWINSSLHISKENFDLISQGSLEEEKEEEEEDIEDFDTEKEYLTARDNRRVLDGEIYKYNDQWGKGNNRSRFYPIPANCYKYLYSKINKIKSDDKDYFKNYSGVRKEIFQSHWLAIRTSVNRLLFVNPSKISGIRFGDYEGYYNMSEHAENMGGDLYWPHSCLNLRDFRDLDTEKEEIISSLNYIKELLKKYKNGEYEEEYDEINYYENRIKDIKQDLKDIEEEKMDVIYKYVVERGFRSSTSQQSYNNLHLDLTQDWDFSAYTDAYDYTKKEHTLESTLHDRNLSRHVLEWFILNTNIYLTNGKILTNKLNSTYSEGICEKLLALKEGEDTFLELSNIWGADDNHYINTSKIVMIDIPLSSILTNYFKDKDLS